VQYILLLPRTGTSTATDGAQRPDVGYLKNWLYLSDVLSDWLALTNSRCLGVKMLAITYTAQAAATHRTLLAVPYQ